MESGSIRMPWTDGVTELRTVEEVVATLCGPSGEGEGYTVEGGSSLGGSF